MKKGCFKEKNHSLSDLLKGPYSYALERGREKEADDRDKKKKRGSKTRERPSEPARSLRRSSTLVSERNSEGNGLLTGKSAKERQPQFFPFFSEKEFRSEEVDLEVEGGDQRKEH